MVRQKYPLSAFANLPELRWQTMTGDSLFRCAVGDIYQFWKMSFRFLTFFPPSFFIAVHFGDSLWF